MTERFVLSVRRTGLGDRIICLCAAWKYARDTQRTLVVDWRHSRYSKKPDNLFPDCFSNRSELSGVRLIAEPHFDTADLPRPIFPDRWMTDHDIGQHWQAPIDGLPGERDIAVDLIRSGNDLSDNTIVFASCINDGIVSFDDARECLTGLSVARSITTDVDRLTAKIGAPMIGLHIRHGNYGFIGEHAKSWTSFERALGRCQKAVEQARSKIGKDLPVFLSTDSVEVQNTVLKRIPNVIIREKYFQRAGAGDLHHSQDAHLGFGDAMTEMCILSRCAVLIRYPSGSFFSFYPAVIKPSSETRPRLIDELRTPSDPDDPLSPAILY